MLIRRGLKYRLYPTSDQEAEFQQFAGVCRLVYNLAFEQRRDWWRHYIAHTGSRLSYVSQARELTVLRAEFDWIAAVAQACQQQALRDLDRAFVNFFEGRAGFPKPRKKGEDDSFRFPARRITIRSINRKWATVRLPKIGWVKFRSTRPVHGTIKNVTVSLVDSQWHIAFACEIERQEPVPLLGGVGIDRGVANAITLSTDERIAAPQSSDRLEHRRRRAQKILARRKKGSKRYARQRARVARLQAKAGRIRRDWLHRVSTNVAHRFGTVAIEDLKVRKMTAAAHGANVRQKAGLNRAILAQGWTIFASMLAYKLEERGGTLLYVDPAYTSQTCSACSVVDARSRKSQAVFECVECGHRDHADVNAAINILSRSTAWLDVEGAHQRPREASTGRLAA